MIIVATLNKLVTDQASSQQGKPHHVHQWTGKPGEHEIERGGAVFFFEVVSKYSSFRYLELYLNNLNKAEGFVDISANRKIIDCDLPQSSRLVDHKQTSEAEMMLTMYFFCQKNSMTNFSPQTLILLENPIGAADGHVLVRKERHRHVAKASLLPGLLAP